MKNIFFTIFFFLFSTIVSAQTFVSTSPENKNVILNQFTGIYCFWCPDGHVIGASMQAANPNDVFLIRTHYGGFSNPFSINDPNLNSQYGSHLANAAGVTGYPTGTVNRRIFPAGSPSAAMSRSNWQASANQILSEPSYVNVAAQGTFDLSSGILTVNTETYFTSNSSGSSGNSINVAIIENNIT